MAALIPKDEFDRDTKLIEASMAMAGFGATRFDARRVYEWRVSFGVWALLAAAAYRGFVDFPVIAVLLALVYGWWLQNLWLRHSSDQDLIWNFANEAQRLLEKHGVKIMPAGTDLRIGGGRALTGWRARWGFLGDWSLAFQFLVTAALIAFIFATADSVTLFRIAMKAGAN